MHRPIRKRTMHVEMALIKKDAQEYNFEKQKDLVFSNVIY